MRYIPLPFGSWNVLFFEPAKGSRQVGGHFIMVQEAVFKVADTLSIYMHPRVCRICLSESMDHRTVFPETEYAILLDRGLGSLVCVTNHGAISDYASFGQIVKRKQETDMDIFTCPLYMDFWNIDRAGWSDGAHTVWPVSSTLFSSGILSGTFDYGRETS